MLRFLLYTKLLLAQHRASSCFKQNRFLLQSGTLKWISAEVYKADLTLPSFWSIWFFQGLLGVSPKSWSPMSCTLWQALPNQQVANPGFYWLDLSRNTLVCIRLHRHWTDKRHCTQGQLAAAGESLLLSWWRLGDLSGPQYQSSSQKSCACRSLKAPLSDRRQPSFWLASSKCGLSRVAFLVSASMNGYQHAGAWSAVS